MVDPVDQTRHDGATAGASGRRRGIYVLPNIFTTIGLFAGFYAVIAAINGRYEASVVAILVAGILDGLDGRVARLTGTESAFGAQYDSMSDLIAFGMGPAILMFEWQLRDYGKVGWMLAFIYAAAVALRLARFNVRTEVVNKRYFQGLASPPSAGLIISIVWLGETYQVRGGWVGVFSGLSVFLCAALMVSDVRYFSFKDMDFRSRVSFAYGALFVLLLAVFFLHPPLVLFGMAISYALSGPVLTLYLLRRGKFSALRRRSRQSRDG